MVFDGKWAAFWAMVPKYANSHKYDMLVYACGTAALLITFLYKNVIKKRNKVITLKHFADECPDAAVNYYRRRNLLVALCAAMLSGLFFGIVSFLSYELRLDTFWTVIVPLVPIAEYSVIEMLRKDSAHRLLCIAILLAVVEINYIYCMARESHHKACYAIKILMLVYGLFGLLDQFFGFTLKINGTAKKKES